KMISFFCSSRRRHTRSKRDWSSDVCSSDLGMKEACIEECDDLILWLSEGKYVTKAMELKMKFTPLTPIQQEKYDHRFEKGYVPKIGRASCRERVYNAVGGGG